MASIDVIGAEVFLEGHAALAGLSLNIADGEAVAILGPSGCGKTTLLRAIAGLQPLHGGSIAYDGVDVTQTEPAERGVGMVFQNYALYPHMQSQGILGFYYKLRGLDAEVGDRVKGVCDVMGADFEGLLKRKPGELSGGQQQRVAIGRCIIREPRVFLFDEPLSNLDARLRAQTRVEIKRLLRRFGVTAVYVSHDQTEATAIGDRIAVMRDGKIEQIGRYRDLHAHPLNTFVATFLGTPPMSLIRGVIEDGFIRLTGPGSEPDATAPAPLEDEPWRGAGRTSVPAGIVRVPFGVRPELHMGTGIILGWRPEAARLVPAGDGAVPAWIVATEPVVADRQILVTCGVAMTNELGTDVSVVVRARAPATADLNQGDRVHLGFDPDEAHVFDSDGTRRTAVVYSAV